MSRYHLFPCSFKECVVEFALECQNRLLKIDSRCRGILCVEKHSLLHGRQRINGLDVLFIHVPTDSSLSLSWARMFDSSFSSNAASGKSEGVNPPTAGD